MIREIAAAPVYEAVREMSNDAAAVISTMSGKRPVLFVSAQVEVAWGFFLHANIFQGIETDFQHFPFMQAVAQSSHPYLAFANPEEIPLDYYFRVANGRTMLLLVVEGGWTSGSLGNIQSSVQKQVRYLRHQEKLLDSAKATAVVQLSFTDLDISSFPPQLPGSTLAIFAQLGLVDQNLVPKASLATYDSIFARRRGF